MGCNCKVNEKIFKINKNYGFNTTVNISEKISFKVKETIKILLLIPIIVVSFPILLIILPIIAIRGNGDINVSKLLNLLLRKKK